MKQCPNCGARTNGMVFCPNCDNRLASEPAVSSSSLDQYCTPPPQIQRRKRKKLKTILKTLLIVILAIFMFFLGFIVAYESDYKGWYNGKLGGTFYKVKDDWENHSDGRIKQYHFHSGRLIFKELNTKQMRAPSLNDYQEISNQIQKEYHVSTQAQEPWDNALDSGYRTEGTYKASNGVKTHFISTVVYDDIYHKLFLILGTVPEKNQAVFVEEYQMFLDSLL